MTPEEFENWLRKGPERRPKAYQVLMGGSGAGNGLPVRQEGVKKAPCEPWKPPPPRESYDYKSKASGEEVEDDGFDAIIEEE